MFIEGWLFIILSVTGARQLLIRLLPKTLSLSMATGIGLFLAHIGLQSSEGLGVVTADGATLVTLGRAAAVLQPEERHPEAMLSTACC